MCDAPILFATSFAFFFAVLALLFLSAPIWLSSFGYCPFGSAASGLHDGCILQTARLLTVSHSPSGAELTSCYLPTLCGLLCNPPGGPTNSPLLCQPSQFSRIVAPMEVWFPSAACTSATPWILCGHYQVHLGRCIQPCTVYCIPTTLAGQSPSQMARDRDQ